MSVSRSQHLLRKALFLTALFLLMVLVLPACVSVQKTGEPSNAPPPATTGVSFQSSPMDGEIYINDEFRGTTPVTLHLPAGTHSVEIRLDGHQTWSRELVVVAGNDTRVAATLQPE